MPFFYQIDKRQRLIHFRVEGTVVSRNLVAHQREVRDDPDFDPTFSVLADFTAVTNVEANNEAVHDLASSDPMNRDCRRALVVDNDVVYGLARMYQMLLDLSEDNCRIFRSMGEAREWLGVD